MASDDLRYEVAIVGGGILGVATAYWLSALFEGERIVLIEKESAVASHASSRNTGVVHRPFYLDPEARRKFAWCAQASYGFWKEHAVRKELPWREVGTLEVAFNESRVARLRKYKQWSLEHGMRNDEVRLLTPQEVCEIEPNVRCAGALLCTTDTAVDFGAFTRALKEDTQKNGVQFLLGHEMEKVKENKGGVEVEFQNGAIVKAHYLINCAGAGALKIAHTMGLARQYADLNFRGEYLIVDGASARLASRNIYSVPRHSAFPFLDPHYVVRHDGRVEIGPTAVPVFGPYTYHGVGRVLSKLTERPVLNKLRLCTNPEFLRLCGQEWRSALSARAMVCRVQKFLPELRVQDCVRHGTAGVRASLIDRDGKFVPEVVEARSPRSLHVLNYNSPGATGAPAFSALLVASLLRHSHLFLAMRKNPLPAWHFSNAQEGLSAMLDKHTSV